MSQDLQIFEYPQTVVTVAKTKSGKTTAFRYILQYLYAKKCIASALVFCSTIWNGDYDFINKERHYVQLDEAVITKLINHRAAQVQRGEKLKGLALIIDDCVADQDMRKPYFQSLISMARHLNMWVFISIQHAKIAPPLIRDNSGIVMLFKCQTPEQKKYAYDLVNWHADQANFSEFLDNNIADYKFLVCNKNEPSNDKKKIFKIMRAPVNHASFVIP